MTDLKTIMAATRRKVAESRSTADLPELEKQADRHAPRGFRRAIESGSKSGPAVIAELKKASPSRGLIRADFDPTILSRELEMSGAAALSVLTEPEFFQGSLHNLSVASASTALPCLRKDFILDELQLVEARAHGADAVLLIVAALGPHELSQLVKRAADLRLDVLCEVHDEVELGRALEAGCDLIGVNSRDLQTFKVDTETAIRVAEMLPYGVIAVAESGIENGAEITRLRSAGYDGFLIGEALMRAPRPGEALRKLLQEAAVGASAS
jgi:indole-3-glycerol phosphate synthase